MAGLQTRTSEANQALWDLSREIRRSPTVAALVAAGRFEQIGEAPAGEEIAAKFEQFLAVYGHRECVTWYLSTPTWRRNPSHVWRLLQSLIGASAPPISKGAKRYLAARAMLSRRLRYYPGLGRPVLWLVERLRALETFRDNSHFDLTRGLEAMQDIAAEWGLRLTRQGLLTQPDDVFYLTDGEVRRWLTDRAPAPEEVRAIVARRRRTYQVVNGRWQRRQFESKVSFASRAGKGASTRAEGTELQGVAAGSGIARAKARIVRGEAQFGCLQPGEVLVCPYTNPSWTPLFASAAAVVAETGGAGAHAAIVAREYGIPAVMGVPGATRLIADGQEVLVDGNTGRVLLGAAVAGGRPPG